MVDGLPPAEVWEMTSFFDIFEGHKSASELQDKNQSQNLRRPSDRAYLAINSRNQGLSGSDS